MNNAALYYFTVRRFRVPPNLSGKELDAWCESVLRNKEVRSRAERDLREYLESQGIYDNSFN